jgi:uncharacterized protein YbjT (DUF2867 family)
MILVVGATGLLGGSITRSLLSQGKPERILVRGASTYDGLVVAGAEPVIGDLKDPDSVRAACRGIDAVITTANAIGRSGEDNLESGGPPGQSEPGRRGGGRGCWPVHLHLRTRR